MKKHQTRLQEIILSKYNSSVMLLNIVIDPGTTNYTLNQIIAVLLPDEDPLDAVEMEDIIKNPEENKGPSRKIIINKDIFDLLQSTKSGDIEGASIKVLNYKFDKYNLRIEYILIIL